jgi:thiamine transporter ThiT
MNKLNVSLELNQNLWSLIIAFTALGFSEYYQLSHLLCLTLLVSWLMGTSILFTLSLYTWKYCSDKSRALKRLNRRRKIATEPQSAN